MYYCAETKSIVKYFFEASIDGLDGKRTIELIRFDPAH